MNKHFSPFAARTVERLKIAMEARQMTAADISRATNISRAALSHYLRGHYTPKYDSILLLSEALNVSHLWLMGLGTSMEGDSNSGSLPPPAQASARTAPVPASADIKQAVPELRDALRNYAAGITRLLKLVDELEALLQSRLKPKSFLDKYLHLSKSNQKVINAVIDAMLATQQCAEKEKPPQ